MKDEAIPNPICMYVDFLLSSLCSSLFPLSVTAIALLLSNSITNIFAAIAKKVSSKKYLPYLYALCTLIWAFLEAINLSSV